MDILRQIQLLRTKINRHNIRYYVYDDSIISDAEYDDFMRELEELEKESSRHLLHRILPRSGLVQNLLESISTLLPIGFLCSLLANAMNIDELESI